MQYLQIAYTPESGWVLSIMSRLLNSTDHRLRDAFDQSSETPLEEQLSVFPQFCNPPRIDARTRHADEKDPE
jgi:hypothetical protein